MPPNKSKLRIYVGELAFSTTKCGHKKMCRWNGLHNIYSLFGFVWIKA
jgi:hypothetical protein